LRTYFKAKSNAENVIKQGMKITLIAKGSLGVVPSAQPCAQRSTFKPENGYKHFRFAVVR